MHLKPFRSIAHNISEMFCVILYIRNAIVHLKKNMLISLHLVQYKFAKKKALKNPPCKP